MSVLTEKTMINKRFESLKNLYVSNWQASHKDLSTFIDPTRGIFNGNRANVGKMIDHQILLDAHATHAKNITSSGLQTGSTDPSRPWFKLTVDNFIADNVPNVREWLDEVSRRMIAVMNKSNIYKVFQNCYDELIQFGTGCFIILEDYEDTIRGRSFTAGEYYLGVDNKGRVNRFARDFEMSVIQLVQEFGLESCSPQVQASYQNQKYDDMIKVRHMIEPNSYRTEGYIDSKNMPYLSCYWETSQGGDVFLDKRGYTRFRVVAPRWKTVTTEIPWGTGPSWHALGAIKELQVKRKDFLIAEQKAYDPPMIEDSSVVGHSSRVPGGITKTSTAVPNSGVRPAYQIDPKLAEMQNSIDILHQEIDKHLFADVFLMIRNMDRSNVTAFEVSKLDQERMMMLGPIYHSLNEEMHDVSIDLIFDIMAENGLIPEPPEGFPDGVEIKVQYISILAQAQKAIGVELINNTVSMIANWNTAYPGVIDNIDIDEAAREVMEMGGAPAKIEKDRERMNQERQDAAQRQNQAIALQAGAQMADSAAKLGKTPAGQGSVLDNVGKALAPK